MPKFSIITPVYNVAPYLRECLDSVLAQTHTEWEAICVDDGSADGSGEILDEYAKKDKRFRVMHQANAGVSAARNAALEMMTGEWFMFVDGDDSIKPDMLERINRQFVEHKVDGVVLATGANRPIERIEFLTGTQAANGYPFNRVFRALKFRQLRFCVGMRYREDLCFWSDALCIEATWRLVDIDCYNYRVRHDSATGRVDAHAFRDLLAAHVHVLGNMREKMGASDVDVWNYVLQTKGNLNGAASFAFSHWSLLSPLERSDAVRIMRETINLIGRNPYDGWNRVCWKIAQGACLVGAVQVVRRMVRKVKRTIHCR